MISEITVIGCGGTGSWLIPPLLRYLNSIKFDKEIKLVDGDNYDVGNFTRQEFPESATGMNKAVTLSKAYKQRYSDLDLKYIDEYIGVENKDTVFKENSIIFSAIDNNKGRKIFIEAAREIRNIVLILPGNNEEDGDVQIFWKKDGKTISSDPVELHPEINTIEDGDRSKMSCEEIAQIEGSEQVIFANLTAATASLMVFYNIYHTLLNNLKYNVPTEIFFNLKATAIIPKYYGV